MLVPVFVPKYVQRNKQDAVARTRSSVSDFNGMGRYSFANQTSRHAIYSHATGSSRHPSDHQGSSRMFNTSSRHLSSPALSEESVDTLPRMVEPNRMDASASSLRSADRNGFIASVTRQSTVFFASEPQPVRRTSRETSASVSPIPRRTYRRTFSADAASFGASARKSQASYAGNQSLEQGSMHSLPTRRTHTKKLRNPLVNKRSQDSKSKDSVSSHMGASREFDLERSARMHQSPPPLFE